MINKKEDHDRKYIAKCTQRKEMLAKSEKKTIDKYRHSYKRDKYLD